MKTTLAAVLSSLVSIVALVGCAGSAESPPEGTQAKSEGELQLTTTDAKVFGTYTLGGETIALEAVRAADVFTVNFKTRGLMLDATIDKAGSVASMDGFALENGADTQMLEADRVLMSKFVKSLDGGVAKDAPAVAQMMQRIAGLWSETSPSLKLDRRVMGEEGRGWSSLCGSLGGVYNSSHDCWSGGFWASKTSVYSYVGYWTDPTYYWRGYWSTSSYDHANWPTEYGSCYGRCGGGCGSSTQYTVDCHNHDNCVRNGHSIASAWCDDQFVSASDDAMFADNCGWN